MFSSGIIAVVGSRSLSASGLSLVSSVVSSLSLSGCSFSVGCCVGADEAALSALSGAPRPSGSVVLSAFGPGGEGACSLSAVSGVSVWASAGGSVSWWAGGGASVPLSARLSSRTRAVVSAASSGVVAFFSSPGSVGSLLACREAGRRSLPVVAFACGFAGAPESLGSGEWSPVSFLVEGGSVPAFQWVPAQQGLF